MNKYSASIHPYRLGDREYRLSLSLQAEDMPAAYLQVLNHLRDQPNRRSLNIIIEQTDKGGEKIEDERMPNGQEAVRSQGGRPEGGTTEEV